MDIPKPPTGASLNLSVSADPGSKRLILVSDIATLNLRPEVKYPARVILTQQLQADQQAQKTQTQTPNTQTAQPHSVQTLPTQTQAAKLDANSLPDDLPELLSNQYLVKVNGKAILISSEKTLALGDKLLLSLDPSSSKTQPTLYAQLAGQGNSATPTASTLANRLSGSSAGALYHPTQLTQTAASQHTLLSSGQNIQQLLQALNLTLDKQIPLQEGFKQLANLMSGLNVNPAQTGSVTNAPAKENQPQQPGQGRIEPVVRQLLQQNLLATLAHSSAILGKLVSGNQAPGVLNPNFANPALANPNLASSANTASSIMPPGLLNQPGVQTQTPSSQAAPTNTLSLPSAGNTVKAALNHSGAFFENALMQGPEKLHALKTQLDALQTNLQQAGAQNAPASTNANQAGNNKLQQALGHSLHKIQSTIEQLLQHHPKTTPGSSAAAVQAGLEASMPDLKASLLSVASVLARQLSRELSAEAIKNLFMLPVTEDYALSPFAFPILPPKTSTSKNLFERQEFTTGQLLKLLAGMLHRLQFNQLNSLLQSNNNPENPAQQSWFFEIPIMNPQQQVHSFNFRIDKEAPQNQQHREEEEKQVHWKLLLSFDLDGLGPIYVQVKFAEAGKAERPAISSILWADKADTLKLLQAEAGQFKNSLENIGLNVTDIRCEHGQPNQTSTRLDRHLVDTRA